jgi:diamine N-acetyltransferase
MGFACGFSGQSFHPAAVNLILMFLRPALLSDLPDIIRLERAPAARQFVGQWSEERHRASMTCSEALYLVSEQAPGRLQAYVILRGIGEDSKAIELKRIVVAAPGLGLGRRILREVVRMAFEDLHAHRLFLDVYEDNARARHLYASFGFVLEGAMRDAAHRNGTWCNLLLMSMLEEEYKRSLVGRAQPDA